MVCCARPASTCPANAPKQWARIFVWQPRAFSEGLRLPPVDILALQEADKGTARTGGHHVARELAEQLQMSWVHAPAGIPRGIEPKDRQWWLDFEEQIGLQDPGDTGVALLSRFPMDDVTRIDLPWNECPWRPRLAVGASIKVGSETIRIFNSHIDPHAAADGLLEQLEVVLDHAGKIRGTNGGARRLQYSVPREVYRDPAPT